MSRKLPEWNQLWVKVGQSDASKMNIRSFPWKKSHLDVASCSQSFSVILFGNGRSFVFPMYVYVCRVPVWNLLREKNYWIIWIIEPFFKYNYISMWLWLAYCAINSISCIWLEFYITRENVYWFNVPDCTPYVIPSDYYREAMHCYSTPIMLSDIYIYIWIGNKIVSCKGYVETTHLNR